MCDKDIHVGLVEDWSLSRRSFVVAGIAASVAAPAFAADGVTETNVRVKTANGSADAALFVPAGKGRWPAVLIWPDALGLRPVFREMGKRLAAQGYVVLVPNPFYRSKPAPVFEGAFDFNNPDDRAKLGALRQALTDEAIAGDAAAYLSFLDTQPRTDTKKRAGVQGYCMGGALSFRTAAAVPGRIGAVASFHGGGLVTDQASSPHLLISKTSATFLIAVARNDDAKEPTAKDVLKEAFRTAGRNATVEVYPADHGWCVPGSQVYDQASAERAWSELLRAYETSLV